MIKFTVKSNFKSAQADIARVTKELKALPQQATEYFRSITPIRTGYARRNTKLQRPDTISADYDYAQRLDQGASTQAPDGMTQPTEQWIKRQLQRIQRGR